MNTGLIIRLVTMALVFLAWAGLMFRTLFLFREREVERSGAGIPSTGGFIRQLGFWLKNPADRKDRQTLFFLTAVLIAMAAIQAMVAGNEAAGGID
ncbi:hypothetical protein KUV65_16700 [Maritalea mobilis]|uniref:hypothetical protein n=1 Tax=Maritalea mobilis TaxID=483324 RepID=UPI001C982E8F|nr:hypothetical protein [Maritalea mobilis]MBY6203014.1 hypothetical protein [Maritalea mobilis]